MMVLRSDGRPARTGYRTLAAKAGISLVELDLATGRTHQIRVHLKHIGHPLVGDPLYGEARWKALPKPVQPVLRRFVEDFRNIVAREEAGSARLEALRAPVEALLGDASWITEEFLVPVPATTATWAVYRSQDPDLCIFTMVVPLLSTGRESEALP